jgi:hypothetical protein
MAAEPEKKIDKLLEAYARKRREDAGEPLEVHPATRRMLQAEVAKLRSGRAESAPPWWQSLFLVWPRFAAALAIFVMLALGVWVFVQNEGQKPKGVTELAARRAPAPDAPVAEDSIRLQEKQKAELDGIAPVLGREEADAKKLAEKSPTILAFDDPAKKQIRDAEKPSSAPMPARPSAEAGKNVELKLDLPAQQLAKSGESLVTATANDKRADLDGSARLLKQNSADNFRFYRQPDSSGVKADDALAKGSLGVPVTAGVSLAAARPTDPYFNFAYAETNFGLVPSLGGYAGNGPVANSGAVTLSDFSSAPALKPATIVATEWAAADRQSLTGNEIIRSRGREFERRDANGTPILERFALEQINDRIRIRDGDGSVYEGNIVATTGLEAEGLKEGKDELRQNRETQLRRKPSDSDAPVMPIQFRVSGTNKAQQLVVINGEMWGEEQLARSVKTLNAPAAPAPKLVPAPVASSPTVQPPAKEPSVAGQSAAVGGRASSIAPGGTISSVTNTAFRPTTLRARVQIGRTNEIELKAIRTK